MLRIMERSQDKQWFSVFDTPEPQHEYAVKIESQKRSMSTSKDEALACEHVVLFVSNCIDLECLKSVSLSC